MTEKEVYSNDNTSIIADEMEFPTEAMTRLLTNINASIQEEMNDLKPLEQYGLEFLEEIRECVTEEERRSIILQTEITDLKDKMMRMQEAFLGALQSQ